MEKNTKEELPIKNKDWGSIIDLSDIDEIINKFHTPANKEGLRHNAGKLRYDLLHPVAQEGIVKVLTAGSEKYEPRNWELGMKWSKVLASLKRHLIAIENGEDYDKETGLLHIDHLQCNAHFLSAYYKIYPQGDDRKKSYLSPRKIGLDIDGVLADFNGGMAKRFPKDCISEPSYWNHWGIKKNFKEIVNDIDFWLNLDSYSQELGFEPHCYITTRPIASKHSEEWLMKNNYPKAEVFTVGESKVEAAKKAGIEVFVDDKYDNFVELNNAGILCYLLSRPWNKRYDVGHLRINSLKELV